MLIYIKIIEKILDRAAPGNMIAVTNINHMSRIMNNQDF